jgi:hypothetical protein
MSASPRAAVPLVATAALTLFAFAPAVSQTNYDQWPVLKNPFESTGGGGIIIDGYDPKIVNGKCFTSFTATDPAGKVYSNKIEFETVTLQGGTLCTKGHWQAIDGSMSGTTPFEVFIKSGVVRRSP